MNWAGYYALALFAAVYPVLLAIVALFLTRPRPIVLLAGLLTGAFLTTMIAGIVLVSVIGSTDVSTGSDKVTVRAWVNIAIGVILIAGAVYILLNRGQRRLLRRKHTEACRRRKKRETVGLDDAGWRRRLFLGRGHHRGGHRPAERLVPGCPQVLNRRRSSQSLWYSCSCSPTPSLPTFRSSSRCSSVSSGPRRLSTWSQSANDWLKGHQRIIAAGIAGGIGIWQLSLGISKLP